jgi:signal transduction histidine kinase
MTVALREVILRLRPAVLDYGLGHALRELIARLSARQQKVEVSLDVRGSVVRYPVEVENHVYRIVQQFCENALRHARAQHLAIAGELRKDRIDLAITDDGAGFAFDAAQRAELIEMGRFGLIGLYERAELIGAMLLIESAPGAGTRVHLRWERGIGE